VKAAELREIVWKRFEEGQSSKDYLDLRGAAVAAGTAAASGAAPKGLARQRTLLTAHSDRAHNIYEEEFKQLESFFHAGLKRSAVLRDAYTNLSHTEQEDFRFWMWISLCMRSSAKHLYMIKIGTWIAFLIVFILFAFCHGFLALSYVWIFLASCIVVVLILIWMTLVVRKVLAQIYDDDYAAFEKVERLDTEYWILIVLQFSLFFLCYGIARFLFAPWMWTYYFYTTIICIFAFILFVAFFCVYLVPMIVLFLAAMALPPYTNDTNLALFQEAALKTLRQKRYIYVNGQLVPDGGSARHRAASV